MNKKMSFRLMLTVRALFVIGMLLLIGRDPIGGLLFNGLIFLATLFIVRLGRDDHRYWQFDALVMIVFGLAMIPSYFGFWNLAPTLTQSLVGFDKIYHAAGGACLALFAALWLKRRVNDTTTFYIGILVFALAIGGAWELFEWLLSILPPPWQYASSGYTDSMLDLVADTLGAVIVAVVLWVRKFY